MALLSAEIQQSKKLGYSAVLIADYILVGGKGCLTPLQLIKLVYISHGHTLGIYDRPLIRDRIEAWKFGPVIPVLYHALKHYGGNPIPNLYYCGTGLMARGIDARKEFFEDAIDVDSIAIMDRVLDAYGNFTGNQLSSITHKPGTPWDATYVDGEFHTPIQNDLIKRHYKEIKNK